MNFLFLLPCKKGLDGVFDSWKKDVLYKEIFFVALLIAILYRFCATSAVRRCAHCACDVRPLANNGVCRCVGRPGFETTFAGGSRNAQDPTKNSSTRYSGESGGNHLLCSAHHLTLALSYSNLRPPEKSDDYQTVGAIDLLATLGSTFACGCCSSRASAMDKKSRTGRVCTSKSSGLNLDLTLGGLYLNYGVPLSGNNGVESRNEVADAPGDMRLQHTPTPASSATFALANNSIESGLIYIDGRWSIEEHERFLTGLRAEGKGRWKQISKRYIKTRTATQVASHTQKYFLRLKNHNLRGGALTM